MRPSLLRRFGAQQADAAGRVRTFVRNGGLAQQGLDDRTPVFRRVVQLAVAPNAPRPHRIARACRVQQFGSTLHSSWADGNGMSKE